MCKNKLSEFVCDKRLIEAYWCSLGFHFCQRKNEFLNMLGPKMAEREKSEPVVRFIIYEPKNCRGENG